MAEIKSWTRSFVERQYGGIKGGHYTKHRAAVQENRQPGRLAGELLLTTILHNQDRVGRWLNLELPADMFFVDAGSQNTVVQRVGSPNVIKINRPSTSLRWLEQAALAQMLEADHAELKRYMGGFIPDYVLEPASQKRVRVEPNPLRSGTTAVIAEQPYVPFDNVQVFPSQRSGLNMPAIERAEKLYPGFTGELLDFARLAKGYHQETGGKLVDTSGPGNVVVAWPRSEQPSLICLDAQPISHPEQHDVDRVMGQVELVLTEYS